MAGKEKMAIEGEGKLKPIKTAGKPLQSRCSTSRELSPLDSFRFLRLGPRCFHGSRKGTTLFTGACLRNPWLV
ncbi:hypothetical protein QJS10_CPB12g00800 [Acorus calamus]|uniref:Uncharacterized protein n=1 Tax=Acorus calamus TaxID=4465 RepID=A0AAV9DPQ9_ACOCL|nr:hypothetical protein QJS10_CPB12g00800 [Acorus calamus]